MNPTVTPSALTQAGLAAGNVANGLHGVVALLTFQAMANERLARVRDEVALEAYAARLESLSLFADADALAGRAA
jgi:hypothetical protein